MNKDAFLTVNFWINAGNATCIMAAECEELTRLYYILLNLRNNNYYLPPQYHPGIMITQLLSAMRFIAAIFILANRLHPGQSRNSCPYPCPTRIPVPVLNRVPIFSVPSYPARR